MKTAKLTVLFAAILLTFVGCASIYTHGVFNALDIKKVDNYLYEVTYNDYDYSIADSVVADVVSSFKPGACSCARKGDFVGRNYDWYFDEEATFVIHTPAANGRHATLSVSSLPFITDKEASEKTYSEYYTILPFVTLDGINDCGLVCSMNIIPGDDNVLTTGTNPGAENLFELFALRYLLDYASSVDEAVGLLNKMNIYGVRIEGISDYEVHLMLSDATKTVAVEFIDNKIVVVPCSVMTNFFLFGYDGTRASLTPHAQGVERYAILENNIDDVSTKNEMIELMKKVRFTQYVDLNMPVFWYSDHSGVLKDFGDLTKDDIGETCLCGDVSRAGAYAERIRLERENYLRGERDSSTWHTLHTSVYSISNRSLTILVQERDTQYSFTL